MRLKRFVEAEQAAPKPEENICGVLVHVVPEKSTEVAAALTRLPGVEVHAGTENGRLIVTIEDAGGEWAGATLTRIPTIDGVIAAALVYQSTLTKTEEPTP